MSQNFNAKSQRRQDAKIFNFFAPLRPGGLVLNLH